MKYLYKNLIWVLFLGLWACEKNDPLSEQGELTGKILPFNLLAQMPDAGTSDTLELRTVTWAVEDDIEAVEFYHEGFKQKEYTVRFRFQTENAGTQDVSAVFTTDTIFIDKTLITSYPQEDQNLNDFYETLENAYVVFHSFVVPTVYQSESQVDLELIESLNSNEFDLLIQNISTLFNRDIAATVFPDINYYSIVYFEIDSDGFYTGKLTEEGVKYVRDNLNLDLVSEFLRDAYTEDNTRVTVTSVSILENPEAFTESSRVFRVTK